MAEPYSGCAEITNAEYVRGHIALLQRGQCMFAEKARHILKAGAIGGIVIGERTQSFAPDLESFNTCPHRLGFICYLQQPINKRLL